MTILGINSTSFASNIQVGEYSKKYQEWLKLGDEEKEKTIPPFPFNVRNNTIKISITLNNVDFLHQITQFYK